MTLSDAVCAKRLYDRYHAAADHTFLIGSTPWDVDEAMVAHGFAQGPFEAEDALGLDTMRAADRSGPLVPRMLGLGKLGRKTGAGWYRYPDGGGKVDDPIVADLALEEAHFGGFSRTDFDTDDIQNRLIHAILAEALTLVRDGAAPDTVDRLAVAHLDFPADQTGPLHLIRQRGEIAVMARLHELAREHPTLWQVGTAGRPIETTTQQP